jgi:hypothetical protein
VNEEAQAQLEVRMKIRKYNGIRHVVLSKEEQDSLKCCPFCGNHGNAIQLMNTWTPSYWIECVCGVELHPNQRSLRKNTVASHLISASLAVRTWNIRLRGKE